MKGTSCRMVIGIAALLAVCSACKRTGAVFQNPLVAQNISGELCSRMHVRENLDDGRRAFQIPGSPPLIHSDCSAIFLDSSGHNVQPAEVLVNGRSIRNRMGNFDGNSGSVVEFGVMHHWQVIPSDSSKVPAIDDSVLAPNVFRITYPTAAFDTVSRSRGFTCTYGNPGTDSVTLIVGYLQDGRLPIDSLRRLRKMELHKTVARTGSYFVSSEQLSAFTNPGPLQVWIIAERSKIGTVSGKRYLLKSVCNAGVYCFLNN